MKGAGLKSLTILAEKVLVDLENLVGTSTTLDIQTVKRRFKDEGLSFLSITLAQFCKDFERSLDRGYVSHDLFSHFAFTGSCPRFLGGFFDLIFDRRSGILKELPNLQAIWAIRQFTGMWSKIEIDCSQERVDLAYKEYSLSEVTVRLADASRTAEDLKDFQRVSSLLFSHLFLKLDLMVKHGEVVPKHGSGSTAEGILGNKKFLSCTWTDRLEYLFPAREFLSSSYSHSFEHDIVWRAPAHEPPVKVIHVPKTLKTPRIIAMEPVHMMYVQQGLMEIIYENVKRDNFLSRFISFEDQSPNQVMAREGSITKELATLDLSAASDLVSNQLVRELTRCFPNLFEAVQASRSQVADVRGELIRLAKFASMGSALCFPMETFVFLTLIFVGIERARATRLSLRDIASFSDSVRVYGDDMIVPVDYVHDVVAVLQSFGLKVNSGKSFWTGMFRESCGKEYYNGSDVSIVKLRSMLPTQRSHVDELVSTVSFRNQAQNLSMFTTVEFLDAEIGVLIPFPVVGPSSPVLGRHALDGSHETHKMCPNLQRPLVKGVVVDARLPLDALDGSRALLKFFLKRSERPYQAGHLKRAGRPHSVRLKVGYHSAV